MSYKKILALTLLIGAISACGGKFKKDQIETGNKQEEQFQTVETFNTVDDQSQADQINQETQVEIEEIEVSDRVFFDLNESSLSSEAKKILDNQTAWLKSDSGIKITIEGHCDERGTREYNIALGERRANSAKEYLVNNGINNSRINTISYGKERPAFVGSGEEIWAKNRRAVTVINE
jgi:peptidoglycan-associated lipoprotein